MKFATMTFFLCFRQCPCLLVLVLLMSTVFVRSEDKLGKPESKLITGMPGGITGLAFDGKVLWACVYKGGGGSLVKIDPQKLTVQPASFSIKGPGRFGAPGSLAYDGKLLWLGDSYGAGLWAIDPANGQTITTIEKVRQQGSKASQGYAGLAHDGKKLWVAWHWHNYDKTIPSQLLLRFDPLKSEFEDVSIELPEAERKDGTHALAWDGKSLWHAKGSVLSQISPADGKIIASHRLPDLKRPSGMTWMDGALWIAEFDGKIWRLPTK